MLPRKEYLLSLPKKRMGSGALIFNKKNEILFLETTYKEYWEIPGGVIELNESPSTCCKREIFEEIGLLLDIEKLLCLEYQQTEFDDSMMFVFDGGVISSGDIKSIILQESEIKNIHFSSLENTKKYLLPKMFKRLERTLLAKKSNTTKYFETIK